MSFWNRIFGKTEKRSVLRDPDGWYPLFGGSTNAGITVTPETALSHPAVLGAVRLIAELTASLPIVVYQRTSNGRERAVNHPVYQLLHEQPNPTQTPFTFKETMGLHLLLHGNAYIAVQWDEAGRPVALWPLHPARTQVDMQPSGIVRYKVMTTGGQLATYMPDDIIHVPLLALDGLVGRSPIQIAREAIGVALASEEHASSYFANAARPSGVLKTAGVLDAEAAQRLKESWQQAYGHGKAGTAVLEDGIEFQPISGNAQESQLIESRQFAMRAIAAVLRIPPHLLDPTSRGPYSNVTTQSLEFLVFSLGPFLKRIEEAFNLKLFTPTERRQYYTEFIVDGLLRTDTQTRYKTYQIGLEAGFLTVAEVRQKENLPPLPEPTPAAAVPPERSNSPKIETRSRKQEIQQKHKPKIEAAARKVIAKERADILALAEKSLGERDVRLLEDWIADYYQDTGWLKEEFYPIFAALVKEAHLEAASEVKAKPWEDTSLGELIATLVAAYAAQHAGVSQATLQPALRAGSEELALEALEQTLVDMENTRPGKIADLTSSNVANETAMQTYREAGVTKIVWQAGPKACPFCKQLSGKTVGIGEPFVAAGEAIPGPQGDMSRQLTARQPRLRPPIHLGCSCTLGPA